MAKKPAQIPTNLQPWIEAQRKFHLSHAQVQMARELGMNSKKLGKLDNHDQVIAGRRTRLAKFKGDAAQR